MQKMQFMMKHAHIMAIPMAYPIPKFNQCRQHTPKNTIEVSLYLVESHRISFVHTKLIFATNDDV
jgi:hypothetical protein